MKNKGKTLILFGLLLIAAALFLTGYNLWDGIRAEKSVKQATDLLEKVLPAESFAGGEEPAGEEPAPVFRETEIPDYILDPQMEMPAQTIDGAEYIGLLRIPALSLELPVISQWSYPDLKRAPCRYKGSPYSGSFILAAHNYPSHFGRLTELCQGDLISFTDLDGNEFRYEVEECEVLPPGAVEEMESGQWPLTLFTCTVGGQSRVTVRCGRTGEEW